MTNLPENHHNAARMLLPRSNCLRRKYAAVIVNAQGRLISVGYNHSEIPCTACARQDIPHNSGNYDTCHSIHAEMMALLGVDMRELRGATLYLVCDKEDKPEPCPICRRMMAWCGVRLAEEEVRS